MASNNPYREAADLIRNRADSLVKLGIATTPNQLIFMMNQARSRAVEAGGYNVAYSAIGHVAAQVFDLHGEAEESHCGLRNHHDGTRSTPVGTPSNPAVESLWRLFTELTNLAATTY